MGTIKSTKDNAIAISKCYEQDNGKKANATVTFGANPADGNYITLNGTKFTFRDSPSATNDVQTGSTISESIDNLLTEALPDVATYTKVDTDKIYIEYKTIGTDGNNYVIEADFTDVPDNLSGGSDTPDGDWVDNTPAVNYKLPEIIVENDSTNTALEINKVVNKGEPVRLYNGTDGLVDGSLGAVTSVVTRFADGANNTSITDAVPTMTNYTSPSGEVIHGGDRYSNSFHAFDDVITWGGHVALLSPPTNNYIGYKFTTPKIINKYTIIGSDVPNENDIPKGWRFEGSNDNITWTTLSTESNINNWNTSYAKKTFTLTNSQAYLYYRIYVTANHSNGTYTSFVDIQFIETKQKTIKHIADISALNLTKAPTKAYLDKPVTVSTATEANASRCIAQDELLDKVSSTTTEFVGTNVHGGLLQDGDSIQIDDTTDVVCSNVVESYVSVDSTATHDIFGDGSAVATYNLDGNANDLGGNYNGTTTGVTYDTGKFGQAAVFNGSSSYIDTGMTVPSSISISAWINVPNINGRINFAGDENTSDNTDYLIVSIGGSAYVDWGNVPAYITGNFSDGMANNTWCHVVVNFSDSEFDLYINNTKVKTQSFSRSTSTTGHLLLGKNRMGTFDGSMDQVRIFNKTLTQDEVTTLYNEQIPKYQYQYQCTIPEQSTSPTSAKVLDRSITTTVDSDTYDDSTGKFAKTYNKIEKQGRAFKYRIEADTDVEIDKITISMDKQE